MNLRLLVAAGAFVASVCVAADTNRWRLAWADEFDKPGLPDSAKWRYEKGFVRNGESQFYTTNRLENARVENGMLVIEGRKERFRNENFKPGGDPKREFAEYTSASLITLGKAAFHYGRIEVRAKLPHGKGVWPAIWMMGTNRVGWPRCGETDIMEYVGHDPNRVHATMHFSKNGKHASKGERIVTQAPYDDFHIYALEWSADRMEFFFDDKKYFTFDTKLAEDNGANPFHKPQYLILNLALGGSWGREIDDAILPQKFVIDYVRAYQPLP